MESLEVLVVDDEPVVRLSVTRVLQGFRVRPPGGDDEVGFTVEAVASGEEGLARLAQKVPHVLLLDYKLPGLSGLQVLEQLPRNSEMLTIMITAYASIDTAVAAMKAGAYDFVVKPFAPDELRAVVSKAAERILLARQAQRLAREKQQARYQLSSVLTHELKTPLAAVESYLRFMLWNTEKSTPAQQEEMLQRCLVRLAGMRSLILDLLDLTSIESGTRERELKEVELRTVAQRVLETMQPAADQHGITLALHAPPALPMNADELEVERLLNNLVSNAVKYNREGGRVDVSLARQGSTVTLSVADTGIGIAPEEAARLFRDFVRVKSEQTRDTSGTGLGLSIVRRLAQLYGGEATVQSTPGAGSTFTVTLRDGVSESRAPSELPRTPDTVELGW